MPLADHFIALGELLLMTNKYPSEGAIDDMNKFRFLLEGVRRWSRDQRNLEDVESKRLVFGRTESGLKPLSIKYAKAFAEFQKELGLATCQGHPGFERWAVFPPVLFHVLLLLFFSYFRSRTQP